MKKQLISILTFIFLGTISVFGQNNTGSISGEVYGQMFSLPGATIFVVGTEKGTATDFDGKFQLNMSNGIYKLQIKNFEFGTLEFDNLIFKSGELRELRIYTESLGEYVVSETIFKNKRAYKKHLKKQKNK